MEYLTLAQIKAKIKKPVDLEEEVGEGQFIEEEELLGYINDGIDKAERIIINLGLEDDYFETVEPLKLTQGKQDYYLPCDIFANKIKKIYYNDGATKYEIARIRTSKKYDIINNIEANDDYCYLVLNSATKGQFLRLYPASRISSNTAAQIWFTRNATRLVNDSDECDIPECVSYVIEYAKGQCLAKENNGVVPAEQQKIIDQEKEDMIKTLSEMIPDGETQIEQETELYDCHN